MNAKQLIVMVVAGLVLIGGAAAIGAASSADAANESAHNATTDVDKPEDRDIPANSSENANQVGPSDGLPSQAADHVSGIHERINGFLNGSVDHLGSSLSEFLTGEESDEDAEEDADDNSEEEDPEA